MLWGVDSSTPAANPADLRDLGYGFVMGYIGGNTPRVWTKDEWLAHNAVGLKLGPIWVAPFGTPDYERGVSDGNGALAAMQECGLSGYVFLDVENGANPQDYTKGFVAACHAGQCSVGLYGSYPTIIALGDLVDAWWLAAWVQSGNRLAPALPDWVIWQYATGPEFDYNAAIDDFPFAQISV